jgi:hypothetical protein
MRPVASSIETLQRQSYARGLLESGVPVSAVATMLCARHGISRSSAYRDITAAHAELQSSDDGPATEDQNAPAPEEIEAMLCHRITVACAAGEARDVAQLVKALDTVKRWRGSGQPHSAWA